MYALHHFRKDIRRYWWVIALWLAVLAVRVAGEGFGALRGIVQSEAGVLDFLSAITPILSLSLVPVIVLGDLPFDERAFWMTRPVRGGDLLRSKALTITFFFMILPLIAGLIALAGQGALAAWWPWLLQYGPPAIALALASWGMTVLIAAGGRVTFLVAIMGMLAFLFFIGIQILSSGMGDTLRAYWFPSRLAVALLVAAAGLGASLTSIYRGRSVKAGMGWALASVVGGGLMLVEGPRFLFPYDLDSERVANRATLADRQLMTVQEYLIKFSGGRKENRISVQGRIGLNPQDAAVEVVEIDAETRLVDSAGRTLETAPLRELRVRQSPQYVAADYLKSLGFSFRDHHRNQGHPIKIFDASLADYDSLSKDGPLRFVGNATVELWERDIVAELPLQIGQEWSRRGNYARIGNVQREGERNLRFQINWGFLDLKFDPRGHGRSVYWRQDFPFELALINREKMEAVPIRASREMATSGFVSPFNHRVMNFETSIDPPPRTLGKDEVDEWLKGARLAVVARRCRGIATLPIDFSVNR
jgi:hypothetical protein